MTAPLYVTAWTTISPYGVGREAFIAGVRNRRTVATTLDPALWSGPDVQACLVPDFDQRAELGKKGTRTMNRVTGLMVSAVGRLAGIGGPDAGLVVGTTTGSVQSMMDFTRDSLSGDRPFDVDPMVIPNSLMNCAAAKCAIWYGIQGPNSTLACGRPSGLFTLAYARRLLLNGRARTVLCAAAEEYTMARAWLDHHSRGGEPGLLGEGAVALSVELDETPGSLAAILAVESGLLLPGADSAGLVSGLVCRALDRAGITTAQVWAAVPSGFHPGETRALADLFGAGASDRVPCTAELLGDTAAVSAMFQLAAALASADDAVGRVVVLTSVDVDGMAAAAVLRLAEGAR